MGGKPYQETTDVMMMTTTDELFSSRYVLSGELHPLLNPVVMTNLLKFLSLRELATCRTVCKTWYDLSLSVWRSSATLRIGYLNNDPVGPYFLNDPAGDGTSFSSLLDRWESDYSSKPFRKARVEDWTTIDNFNVKGQEDVTRFWKLVGAHLKKLKLKSCHFTTADDLFKILIEHCPNLKTLNLSKLWFSDSRENYIRRMTDETHSYRRYTAPPRGEHHLKSLTIYYPAGSIAGNLSITYLELLSTFPHLTTINLHSRIPDHDVVYVLRSVRILRDQQGLEHACPALQVGTAFPVGLPSVDLPSLRRWEKMLQLIRELRVTLQSISVAHMSCATRIKEAVELNSQTLTTLIASMIHPLGQRCRFPFGIQLDKLQLLIMSEDFCESFQFIKYTPNLKKLIIDEASADGKILPDRLPRMTSLIANSPMPELENVRLLKLNTLKIQSMVSEDDLKCLIRWFPNVTELEMYLDDNQFAIVCENWPNLWRLEVYGNDLTDEGVTGLKFSKGIPQSKKIPLTSQPRRANIASLKSLIEFSFIGARLTELSVFHGFLKNGSLSKIFFGTQFRKSMLGKKARNELDRNYVQTVNYSSHEAKYKTYDLRTALSTVAEHDPVLLYYRLVKLP